MRYFFLLLAVHFSNSVSCQDEPASLYDVIPRHAVRFSPLHLLNFYPTVQAGYEVNIRDRFSVYAEGGAAVNLSDQDQRFLNKRGIKLKLEPRYYLSVNQKGNVLWYAATEFYYNRIDFDRKASHTECYDGDCQILFERHYLYRGSYRERGVGIKGGIMVGRNRLFLDISSGFALRVIDYDLPDIVSQCCVDNVGWFDIPNESDRAAPSPLLGIRVGYRLHSQN